MSDSGTLPNFFIIGAPKCGTTALHFYLDQHPEIAMSSLKEPHVFSQPRWMAKREDYAGILDPAAHRRGESSTSYARYPAEGDASVGIHEHVPDAKLIYMVGDPVERVVSDYLQTVAVGVEQRGMREALGDIADPANWYVCASRYAAQLKRYLRFYDSSDILVVSQSELREDRSRTLAEIFAFLNVAPSFWSREFEPEIARRDDHVRYGGMAWRLRESFLGDTFRRAPARLRLPVARAVRRTLARPVPRSELDADLRAELTELLAPEVDELARIVGGKLGREFAPYLGTSV